MTTPESARVWTREVDEFLRKPFLDVVQYDGFDKERGPDPITNPDGEDGVTFTSVRERRNTDCLRVQIPARMNRDVALRLLRKIVDVVERDGVPTMTPDVARRAAEDALWVLHHGCFSRRDVDHFENVLGAAARVLGVHAIREMDRRMQGYAPSRGQVSP